MFEYFDYMQKSITILVSDLNYGGGETVKRMSRVSFDRIKKDKKGNRFDGRYLYQRCSESKAKSVDYKNHSDWYNKQIAKKYGVSENWSNNRWFVEQVRPTL